MKVITYVAPYSARKINLTEPQVARLKEAQVWPKDHRGEEFCNVDYGLHAGTPTLTDEEIETLIEGTHIDDILHES